MSLTSGKAESDAEAPQGHLKKEAKKEEEAATKEGESKPVNLGYGANKKFPYIDE